MTTTLILKKLNAAPCDLRAEGIADRWNEREGDQIILTQDGVWMLEDETYYCPAGGVYYSTDEDFVDYQDSRRCSGQAHPDNLEGYFRDERLDVWFYSGNYWGVEVEGETVCREHWEDELYYWESDGDWHWEPEPEPEDDGVRTGYHRGDRSGWTGCEGVGIELEMLANSESALEDICNTANNCEFLAEEDGSLDDQLGVEVVSPPIPLRQWEADAANPWRDFLSAVAGNASAHNAGTGYGLHVSLSLSLFSELQLAKFVVFINQHVALSQAVAQRRNIYSGGYNQQTRCKKFKLKQTGKYEPVKVDNYRAEVRIFRANMRWDRLQKAVQFCLAVREFVTDQSVADVCRGGLEPQFREFVKTNKKQYKQLNQFLTENQ